ncbi:biotin-dependent carboxyltransferase [Aerococcaceae bacterium DSM 111176]|nr:biotin-dependent carboxyltransferase [Aerococcaceae bacterium DSM 111176]
MAINVLKPGLQTTIQDLGRRGYQGIGVIVSGAMDHYSFRIANLLVGNDQGEGALEITMTGPTLEFTSDTLISLTGADLGPVIDGRPVKMGRPVAIKAGSILTFSSYKSGARTYLAVSGGFDIDPVMGSKSTNLRGQFGGFNGRALAKGDHLETNEPTEFGHMQMQLIFKQGARSFGQSKWFIADAIVHPNQIKKPIRMMAGLHYGEFTPESKFDFYKQSFEITLNSDRMGYRLQGPKIELKEPLEIISEVVNFGTIQVPNEGNPIILMVDHQTAAGYPIIGQVSYADLPRLAQLRPGDKVRFEEIDVETSERLFYQMERDIERIAIAINGQ